MASTRSPKNLWMPDRADRIAAVMAGLGPVVVACSGGIDSLLLATVAHRRAPGGVVVAHAISPAVPGAATSRVREQAAAEGWDLRIVRSGEFSNEDYLANPVNRCYFCKSNLYASLTPIAAQLAGIGTVLSGANLDDLGEYRPGLAAAAEAGVRHPWIEADFAKADIRALARTLGRDFADLPASPCLASRLYTGTRVTPARLAAIEACEALVRQQTGIAVVRCRVRATDMLVEVQAEDRGRIGADILARLVALAQGHELSIASVTLDPEPYRAGRSHLVDG